MTEPGRGRDDRKTNKAFGGVHQIERALGLRT